MNAPPRLLLCLFAVSFGACSWVTDFDRGKLGNPDAAQPDAPDATHQPCGLDGGPACGATCGNGSMEPGETCDPPSSCPAACDDGTACTADKLVGSSASCNATCEFIGITTCVNRDGCCPTGCDSSRDDDCSGSCGDGVIDRGETCDPTRLCPTDCNDGNACTIDTLTGSIANCNAACSYRRISMCVNRDGCCPATCSSLNDDDCAVSCGNSAIDPGETCDPPGSCRSSCDDGNACTIDSLTGSAKNCNVACASQVITQCSGGDGCCPPGCNAGSDSDCSTSCGNEVVETGETCDPPGSCPTSCDDGSACTIDSITGSAKNCTAACRRQQVTQCTSGDGCCPAGCNANTDSDCSRACGNGVIEPGETCDPPSSCKTSCDDGSACTIDSLIGSVANCTAACTHQAITQCSRGDGCCPPGCSNNNDRDCSVTCDNGSIETGETCDPILACLLIAVTGCNDGNACTLDSLSGSAANCTVTCTRQPITTCRNGDGCCPPGCNSNNDNNCSASCGNGVVEAGETCDPQRTCPTSCNDGNSCTIDSITGSAANCNVACTRQTITTCQNGDGCCPGGCNATNDNNCSASCGNRIVEAGETCDPPSACAMINCNDGVACTRDTPTGSPANCTSACAHQTITACENGDSCCPPGCNANTDNDCSPTCGNGTREGGETCDPPSMCQMLNCNDSNACTIDGTAGSAASCTLSCTHQTITSCANGDGCCAPGCTAANDNDCLGCGNGRLESGETCDPPSSCPLPASCVDTNACTIDNTSGSAATCNFACARVTISACANGDGCCPTTCTPGSDNDCAGCGNGMVETGETCDPPGSCPSCTDSNPCTVAAPTGSAASCNLACNVTTITQCSAGDGCCPSGGTCNIGNDSDCSARCGDGVVTLPETCDPPGAACLTSCPDDGDPCTQDVLSGTPATCDVTCTHPPITGCVPDAGG